MHLEKKSFSAPSIELSSGAIHSWYSGYKSEAKEKQIVD